LRQGKVGDGFIPPSPQVPIRISRFCRLVNG
jgi:hypothetical protein